MTYNDILESMCMRVQNGNLCMIKEELNDEVNSFPNKNQNVKTSKSNTSSSTNKSINTLNNNSYIYNKYFQNHKQNDTSENTTIADDINILKQMLKTGQLTPQEYLQKVKSKKLLFSNSNINISRGNHQQPNNMNKLFRFVGPGPHPYPPTNTI